MNADPRSFNRPARQTLGVEDIPALGEALLSLTRELWVLSDRVMVLEAVLEQRGVAVQEAIESFEPDEALAALMKEKGTALVQQVLAPFEGQAD